VRLHHAGATRTPGTEALRLFRGALKRGAQSPRWQRGRRGARDGCGDPPAQIEGDAKMRINTFMLAVGLTAALAMPALAKSAKNQPPAMAKAAMPASTKTFVKKAGMTNLFEIKAGKIAQQKSDNSKVRDYATMIVSDHQKAQDNLKAAVKGVHGVSLPSSLDRKHRKLIEQLQSASGANFLKTFKTQQVKGHKDGVKLFQAYARAAQNDKLKRFAQKTLPALKKHLQYAEKLPTSAPAPTVGTGMHNRKK
jgi:putative membrane protein